MAFGLFGSLLGSFLDYQAVKDTNTTNRYAQYDTNLTNRDIARETNATNMALNQANIEMQERQNEINRAREDDAVRRRVNDLIGAGLSKTLAAGSPASANAMQAPQNTFQAQTGHAMVAPKSTPYKGFETAMYHRKQAEIADKELDLKGTELDIAQQEADEKYRHNLVSEEHDQAVIDENRRWHDIENEWKNAELNQNSEFHQDAMKLDWAKATINYMSYLTDARAKEVQNIWYSTQTELAKNEDERASKRLTADLAESQAKVASYLSGIRLDKAQIDYLKKESSYLGAETAYKIAQTLNVKASTQDTLASAYTKLYNVLTASKQGTTTSGHVVSESEATENSRNRWAGAIKTGVTVGAGLVGVAVGGFLKSPTGGKMLRKMFGDDRHEPFGFH